MGNSTLKDQRAALLGVGHSHVGDSETAGREAVRMALVDHQPTSEDLIILFVSADQDLAALYRAAIAEAAPAGVFGCSSTGGFTDARPGRATSTCGGGRALTKGIVAV